MNGKFRAALAAVMVGLTIFSGPSQLAMASEVLEPENVQYNEDGTLNKATFGPYHIYNRQFDQPDGKAWINARLTDKDFGAVADQLSQDWGPIAGAIFSTNSSVTVDSRNDKKSWDEWFGPQVKNGDDPKSGCFDVTDALMGRHKKNTGDKKDDGADRYNMDAHWHQGDNTYLTSGLQKANNMDEVLREMCNMSVKGCVRGGGEFTNNDDETVEDAYKKATETTKDGVVPPLAWMKATNEDGKSGDGKVFYRIATSAMRNDRFFSNTYALAFYDFQLAPLTADGITVPEVDYSCPPENVESTSSYIKNDTECESNNSLTLGNTTHESLTNTFSNSKTITHGTEVGFAHKQEFTMEAGVIKGGGSFEVNGKYNWSEAVQSGYSDAKSKGQDFDNSVSTSITLPPHTAAAIVQSNGILNQTIKYDCPVVLNYKVAVLSLSFKPESDVDYVKSFCAKFGSGNMDDGAFAVHNLYRRAVDPETKGRLESKAGNVAGFDQDRGRTVSGIEWNKVEKKYNKEFDTANRIKHAATSLALFSEGAEMNIATTSKNTKLGDLQPLYTLDTVKLVEGDKSLVLTTGETMNLGGLKVAGYDNKGIAYHGFRPDKGTWVLSDANGNELDGSDIVTLSTDPVTDVVDMTATSAGTVYLKYVLSDDIKYNSVEGDTITRENPPAHTAMVRVLVNDPKKDMSGYTIVASGEGETVVNEPLNLNGALSASVHDASDCIISKAVNWQAQDQYEGSPVSIDEAGNFLSTAEGDYQVRATYGDNLVSNWLTVHVGPATEVQDATVNPNELDPTGGDVTTTFTGCSLRNGIEVFFTEQATGDQINCLTSGDEATQATTVTLPANEGVGEDADKHYEVTALLPGSDEPVQVGEVVVRAQETEPIVDDTPEVRDPETGDAPEGNPFDVIKYEANLTLDEAIAIDLHASELPADTDPADYTVKYWMGDDEANAATTQLSSLEMNDIEVARVTAAEMSDPVHIRVYHASKGDEPIKSVDYSVRDYCNKKIAEGDDQNLVALCQATLDYGTYAQKLVKYRLDDLANRDHSEQTEAAVTEAVIPAEHAAKVAQVTDGFASKVATIQAEPTLDSQVNLGFTIEPAKGVSADDITVTVDGETVGTDAGAAIYKQTTKDGNVFVRISGINARDLDHRFQVTVSAGNESKTIEYSALSYAYNKAQEGGDLANISKALYNYWKAANTLAAEK